ncbi:MAG: M15 family metallopeptidase [Eubacterium sp.]
MSIKIKDPKKFLIASVVTLIIFIVILIFIISKVVGIVGGWQDKGQTTSKSSSVTEVQPSSQPVTDSVNKDGNIKETIEILVNKTHSLPKEYVPSDLVAVPLNGIRETQMRSEASNALVKLFDAGHQDDVELKCCSGYRSYDEQESIYQWNVETYGQEEANLVSAKPGESEHQTGLSMDITSESVGNDLLESFADTAEGQWLAKNAHEYGFIIRFPKGKTDITGYSYEPWHIRYIGQKKATEIYNQDQTYEEYLGVTGN